jgi:hypothetical protein
MSVAPAGRDPRERSALRRVVAAFGLIVSLAGLEHGVGEMLQGPVAAPGLQRARALLTHREADGTIRLHPYAKWQGPHWTPCSLESFGATGCVDCVMAFLGIGAIHCSSLFKI